MVGGPSLSPGGAERFSSQSSPSAGTQLIYLYIDPKPHGCRWCKLFSPEWEKFVKQQGPALSEAGVTVAKIDGQVMDPRVAGLDVKGYPTIIIIPAGAPASDAVIFDGGARSAATMVKFVQDNVPTFAPVP